MNANQALRAEMIEDQRQFVADCRDRLESYRRVILGQGWVVVPAGLNSCLAFDIDANGVASNPRVVCILSAHLFCRQDAENLAANCRNGAGEPARAMHIRDAIQRCIDAGEALIGSLERIAA